MNKKSTDKMGNVRTTVIFIFLLVGLLPALAASGFSFYDSQKALKQAISSSQKDLAIELMDKIDREIEYAFLLLRNWIAVNEIVRAAVEGSDQDGQALREEWLEDGLTENSTAALLKKLQATSQDRFKEVFMTDRRGYIIAATNKTSDFDQGPQDDPPDGELWWAAAIRQGEFCGRVSFDESAGVFSLDIALRIDSDGSPVGVLKASYNMEHILSLVNVASRGDSMHYELVNEEGVIIAAKERSRDRLLQDSYSVDLDDDLKWDDLVARQQGEAHGINQGGQEVLVGYAMSRNRGFRPATWMTLSYIPMEEAYEQAAEQFRGFAIILFTTVALIMLVSYTVANKVIVELGKKERMELELEGARKLQLSMLPREVPVLPNVDIAWSMQTATEVGGDYYDYALGQDGTLTIALGDATGHGSEAGTLVSATKSLFRTLSEQTDIAKIFTVMSRTLRDMNLQHIGMALNMVKIEGDSMQVSSAGIPPVLHYSSVSRKVQEILIEGIPLGFLAAAEYEERIFELVPGDAIVMMSDGLPERVNTEYEEYGYPRVFARFAEVATEAPETIIQHLLQGGADWAEGRPQDDDITLVVLKIKK